MRLFIILMVVAAAVPLVPGASAHACQGVQSDCKCPVPNDGQYHAHQGPGGQCANGASQTPGGQSVPGVGAIGVLVAVALAVVAFRRA